MDKEKEEFFRLLSGFNVGILTTHSEKCGLHSRPMTIADRSNTGEITLVSGKASEKVEEIKGDESVSFSCQSEKGKYLTLSGSASLVEDKKRIKDLWRSEFDAQFPDGPSEALLIVIKPRIGEYWNNIGFGKARCLEEPTRAQMTDTKPEPENQHGTVHL